jgi:hypothetical protein
MKIHVITLNALMSGILSMDKSRTNSENFIGCETGSNAAPTDRDSATNPNAVVSLLQHSIRPKGVIWELIDFVFNFYPFP